MVKELSLYRYHYTIAPRNTINRWWLSDEQRTPAPSERSTFDAEINSGEAYVQIVYPVRTQFIKRDEIRSVTYDPQVLCPHLYTPFEQDRVNLTDFIFTPHRLSVYAKTWILAESDMRIPVELFTCGGVKLWVNGDELICFTPYTRNISSSVDLEIPLKAGSNEILIFADELAERDVFFYFGLKYLGTDPLTGLLEIPVEPHMVDECESYLTSLSFTKDLYIDEPIMLSSCEVPPSWLSDLSVESLGLVRSEKDTDERSNKTWANPVEGSNEGSGHVIITGENLRSTGTSGISVGTTDDYRIGIHEFFISVRITDGMLITRKLVTAYDQQPVINDALSLGISERKQTALTYLAHESVPNINRALAQMEVSGGYLTPDTVACYHASLDYIKEKRDCSDFYLPPLLLFLQKWGDRLDESLLAETRAAILDYRYWIDEPGDDVMWFFSENHAFMFHTSQYLAGSLYPEETFLRSGREGYAHRAVGLERLREWFRIYLAYGYAEWNSITYIPVDMIGFFSLLHMAPDQEIVDLARQSLDKTFEIFALHDFHGVVSSSFGRTYEVALKARIFTEPSLLNWITTGTGFFNRSNFASVQYAMSDYVPQTDRPYEPVPEGCAVETTLLQGANGIRIYTYGNDAFSLSSTIAYRPHTHGHQQHIMNIALGDPTTQFFLNHPGERSFSGGNRPSYWAGNGTLPLIYQHRASMLIRYHIHPAEAVDYIHIYLPVYALDELDMADPDWLFARVGEGFLGVRFSAGYELTLKGANSNREIISAGRDHEIIVTCGDAGQFGDLQRFASLMLQAEVSRDSGTFSFQDPRYGDLTLSPDDTFTVNGEERRYLMTYAPKQRLCEEYPITVRGSRGSHPSTHQTEERIP